MNPKPGIAIHSLLLTLTAAMLLSLAGCKTKPEMLITTRFNYIYIEIKGNSTSSGSTRSYTRKVYIAENGKQRKAETTVTTITRLGNRQITKTNHLTEVFVNDTLQLFDSADSTICHTTAASLLSFSGIQPLDTDFWFLKEFPALQHWEIYPDNDEIQEPSKKHFNGYVYQFNPGLLLSIESETGNYYESATRIITDSTFPATLFQMPKGHIRGSNKLSN
jgi:hypothetical protein